MDELASLVRQGKKISLQQSAYFMFSFFTAFSGEVVDRNGRCIADQNSGFVEGLEYLQALAKNGAMLSTGLCCGSRFIPQRAGSHDHQRRLDVGRLQGCSGG